MFGMNGLVGVTALQHVEEDHSLLPGQYQYRHQVGEKNATGTIRKARNVGCLSAQSVVSGMNGLVGVTAQQHVEEDHSIPQGQY